MGSLQEFLVVATEKAKNDLIKAVERIPADKLEWKASENSRSAIDQAAECALLNGSSAELAVTRSWKPEWNAEWLMQSKADIAAQGWPSIKSLLEANTQKMIEVIRAAPDADLNAEIQMPWGPMSLQEELSYPFWNMTYHEGQINFIAVMLGAL